MEYPKNWFVVLQGQNRVLIKDISTPSSTIPYLGVKIRMPSKCNSPYIPLSHSKSMIPPRYPKVYPKMLAGELVRSC